MLKTIEKGKTKLYSPNVPPAVFVLVGLSS